MDNRPIGFFDSGIGGLTCIPHFRRLLPRESIVYFGDTARTPYGSKSLENIRKFSFQISDYLASHDVKMIVIACNTISATCLDALRRRHPELPIIGIIDPIAEKLAGKEYSGVEVGVIGTKVTISSGAYANMVADKNKYVKMFSIACPAFVPLIEEGIINNEIMDLTIKYYLDDFIEQNKIKKLVLGCTHYPIIKEEIHRLYPELGLLNPSEEVVNKIIRVLGERDAFAEEKMYVDKCYASDLSPGLYKMVDRVFEDSDSVKVDIKKFED